MPTCAAWYCSNSQGIPSPRDPTRKIKLFCFPHGQKDHVIARRRAWLNTIGRKKEVDEEKQRILYWIKRAEERLKEEAKEEENERVEGEECRLRQWEGEGEGEGDVTGEERPREPQEGTEPERERSGGEGEPPSENLETLDVHLRELEGMQEFVERGLAEYGGESDLQAIGALEQTKQVKQNVKRRGSKPLNLLWPAHILKDLSLCEMHFRDEDVRYLEDGRFKLVKDAKPIPMHLDPKYKKEIEVLRKKREAMHTKKLEERSQLPVAMKRNSETDEEEREKNERAKRRKESVKKRAMQALERKAEMLGMDVEDYVVKVEGEKTKMQRELENMRMEMENAKKQSLEMQKELEIAKKRLQFTRGANPISIEAVWAKPEGQLRDTLVQLLTGYQNYRDLEAVFDVVRNNADCSFMNGEGFKTYAGKKIGLQSGCIFLLAKKKYHFSKSILSHLVGVPEENISSLSRHLSDALTLAHTIINGSGRELETLPPL